LYSRLERHVKIGATDIEKKIKRLPTLFEELVNQSRSQLSQDLFVLGTLNFIRNGFFVEVGATNGIELSNTCLMEKYFDWTGLLVEPARIWHQSISKNRTALIDHRAVWSESRLQLPFSQTKEADLSTLTELKNIDHHALARSNSTDYLVETVTLGDLFREHSVPSHIDYLSLDTEGSELNILRSFEFDQFSFGCLTVEHNFTAQRDEIYKLLTAKGYRRVKTELSEWDDWYVNDKIFPLTS